MYFSFIFKVLEFDYENKKYHTSTEMGICDGSYADAASQIEQYFGNDLVRIQNIEILEDNRLIFLPEDIIKQYRSYDCMSYTSTMIEVGEENV